jgi:hypothetical protein
MIRTVITPDKQNISIKVPADFVGKQVEVIAFAIDDTVEILSVVEEPLTHYASEKVLAKDWLTPEEDKAWRDL